MNKREIEVTFEKFKKEVVDNIYKDILFLINSATSLEELEDNIKWRIRQNARR